MKYLLITFFALFLTSAKADDLKIGYSTSITNLTVPKMKAAKLAGIDFVEVSINGFIHKDSLTFLKTEEEIENICRSAKISADLAGVKIWSIHMPFNKNIDLSLLDEDKRMAAVTLHKKVLHIVKLLKPQVILFHPSYFLGLEEREARKKQLIASATELNKDVKKIGAMMVIENMTGFELVMKDGKRERPLMRTVEETVEIFDRLPKDVYSAIDLNHIASPEKLILAMGDRLKTLHVADGFGKAENHFFPCDGLGGNDWGAIISALKKVNYQGPFMYESKTKDLKDYKDCYTKLKALAK